MSGLKEGLSVKIEGDELIVRIGIATLAFAAEQSEAFVDWDDDYREYRKLFEVSDNRKFAKGVCEFLLVEEEDGSTLIERALDSAFHYAIENDCGVEETNKKAQFGK
jgi:hypothetical protein